MTTTMTSVGWRARGGVRRLGLIGGSMRSLLFVFVLGCETGGNVAAQPDLAQDPAVAGFWNAFFAQGYASLPSVRTQLQASHDAQAGAENTLLLAHSNLWTLAEFGRDPRDPSQLPPRAMDAQKYFTEAQALAPDDHRIQGRLAAIQIAIGDI